MTDFRRMPPSVRMYGDPRGKEATWTLLPLSDPDVCSQCGRHHDPAEPHDRGSVHYQYAFYAEHDRWPTWADAMAHCTKEVQEAWRTALRMRNVPEEELRHADGS